MVKFNVAGLTRGQFYRFKVSAQNTAGRSAPSPISLAEQAQAATLDSVLRPQVPLRPKTC